MDENKNNQNNLLTNETIIIDRDKIVKTIDLARISQKSIESMHENLAEKAMESVSLSSVAQGVLDSMKKNYDIQKSIESMHENLAEKAMKSVSLSSVAQGVLDSMKKNYDIQKSIESMHENLAEKAMKSVSLSSVAQSVLDSMKKNYDIQKSIESMHENLAEKAMKSVSLSSVAQSVLDSLKNNEAFYQSVVALAQADYRDSAFDIINENVLNNPNSLLNDNIDFDISALKKDIKELSGAENQKIFSDIFAKIPFNIQMIIIFIFMQIILPHINNISANLMTPYVDKYLLSSSVTDKVKIKKISKIKLDNPVLEVNKLRFITRNNVILRSSPSTKTEILDELCLGQVVTVLSKKRNWIEVQYIDQDNEIVHGWVFTRYTARFKK